MMNCCTLCPRNCKANRTDGKTGFCRQTDELRVARAALHFWEEPCISGSKGSGTIFFSGCTLGCIYCQNRSIALGESGKTITPQRLTQIFFELEEQGAHNINLVTPTHYVPTIAKCIANAKQKGITIPFVYNTGGYEKADTLKLLDGLIDIYMPDFKYWSESTAKNFSFAADYPQAAKKAIEEMVRQCPECVYDDEGIMQKGVIVRHMLLPKHVYEAKRILTYLHESYGEKIVYSIMSQYTPITRFDSFDELNRKVTKKEYDSLVNYAIELGIENAYIQDGEAASESFVPPFDNFGV